MAETERGRSSGDQEVWGGPAKFLVRLAIVIGILIFPAMIYWPNYQDWKMRREYTTTTLEQLIRMPAGKVRFTSDRSRYADTRIVVLLDEANDFVVVEVPEVDTPMEEGDVSALAEGAQAEYFGYWNGVYLSAHDIRGSITYFQSYHRDYIPPEIPAPTDSTEIEPPLSELDTLRVADLWESRVRRRSAGRAILPIDTGSMRYRDDGTIIKEGKKYKDTMGYVVLLNPVEQGPACDEDHYPSIMSTIMREKVEGVFAVVNYVPEENKEDRIRGRLGEAQVEWLHLPNRTLRLR